MPSSNGSLKVFSGYASRLFERNLRASLEVSSVSVTSAGLRHLRLRGLDLHLVSKLWLVQQGSPLVLRSPSAFRSFGMILNMDEFHVMDLKPSLAVTIDPFFSCTTRGSGLKGVLNLFFFVCLTSTISPGLILLGFVFSFESAYALIFDFCSASLSAMVF